MKAPKNSPGSVKQVFWNKSQPVLFWAWTAFIIFILSFNFFVVGRYSVYPWWHQHNNDSDAAYAAQTVTLINGARLSYVHHPGATVYMFDALAYRAMAAARADYRHLLRLKHITNMDGASDILESAVRISRIVAFGTAALAVPLIFSLICRYTSNVFIGGAFTFYIILTPAFLQHSYKVRPELLSLLFVLAAWLVLARFPRHLTWAGFFLAASVFSKIQTGPLIVFTLAGVC